jgi:hypothetical protein
MRARRGRAEVYQSRPAFHKTLLLNMRLTSFSPTPGYPGFDLYRNGCRACAIHNGVHPFDHGLLQPSLGYSRLFCVALDDHLIVTDKDGHGPRTLASALP